MRYETGELRPCGLAARLLTGFLVLFTTTAYAQTVVYDIPLNGLQVVPQVTTTGSGTASITLDTVTRALTVTGTYTGLGSAVTDVHYHRANPGGTGPIVVTLTHTGGTTGTFSGAATLSMGNFNGTLGGMMYVDVHTSAETNGEIRGQVVELDNIVCPAELPTDPVLTDCGGDPNLSPRLGSLTETFDLELDCSGAAGPGAYVMVLKLNKRPMPQATNFGLLWFSGPKPFRCPGVHNQDANKCIGSGGLVLPADPVLNSLSYVVQGVCLDPSGGGPRLSNAIVQTVVL